MDNIIENIYLKNNFPGFENLYKLVKVEHNDIKKKDIKLFLENQKEYELLKVKIKKKKKPVILRHLILKILRN
jgi:ribosomal protein L25 (general stress protein Ctc)